MSLLSYRALQRLARENVITNVTEDLINSTSIDITLGPKLLVEQPMRTDAIEEPWVHHVRLRERDGLVMKPVDMETLAEGYYTIQPGEFLLAHSVQTFNLPHSLSAEYKLKSSMARIGLEHLNAGWCDAGWNGSVLTLELKNMTRYHTIRIRPGDRIGQVVFFQHTPVPADASYAARGRYNGDNSVKGIKP